MNISDISALQKWAEIPKHLQEKVLNNVWCSNCHVTTIIDYTMKDHEGGYLIGGKCKKCGKRVARFIEDD